MSILHLAANTADSVLEYLWPTPQPHQPVEPRPVTTLDDVVSQLAQLTYLVEDIRNLLANSPLGELGPAAAPPPDAAAGHPNSRTIAEINAMVEADQRIAARLNNFRLNK